MLMYYKLLRVVSSKLVRLLSQSCSGFHWRAWVEESRSGTSEQRFKYNLVRYDNSPTDEMMKWSYFVFLLALSFSLGLLRAECDSEFKSFKLSTLSTRVGGKDTHALNLVMNGVFPSSLKDADVNLAVRYDLVKPVVAFKQSQQLCADAKGCNVDGSDLFFSTETTVEVPSVSPNGQYAVVVTIAGKDGSKFQCESEAVKLGAEDAQDPDWTKCASTSPQKPRGCGYGDNCVKFVLDDIGEQGCALYDAEVSCDRPGRGSCHMSTHICHSSGNIYGCRHANNDYRSSGCCLRLWGPETTGPSCTSVGTQCLRHDTVQTTLQISNSSPKSGTIQVRPNGVSEGITVKCNHGGDEKVEPGCEKFVKIGELTDLLIIEMENGQKISLSEEVDGWTAMRRVGGHICLTGDASGQTKAAPCATI